ncbi:hypothetical protein BMT55_03505 [Listeria newyorkensis]|uniref:Pectate lyase superfamily protein domain-containing protein n=1 Tax=Listeria newyorkensis TaxID=1497681 RepID=A0ABX4XPG3_9LIST|nr:MULTISPECIES: glycosyl hydrolase family 28-related protein [Listeria]KGL41301.1 hypothetical protein EP56_12000 [Listeriaceae bacterium FSL A5-0209]KGL44637.1 hypothetical protein EP58_03930 [Listeria newyorkensis]KMT62311.1 hypothetical protein X559_1356 [Listeria newyorkensis]PNP93847.1 hypothetical protein BMT55_03505 [Listeria newyorkensis]RQW67350.1 hypothetical protein DUK53_06220 [Listeria sp. SHR_NRA_18]
MSISSIINIADYGAATTNSGAENSEAIREALDQLIHLKGGILFIPLGTYKINETITIDYPGIYIRSASPYRSMLSVETEFTGSEVIRFEPGHDFDSAKSVGIENGLTISCQNATVHGITVIRGYDQLSFRNVEIRGVNKNHSAFNFTQTSSNIKVLGQTLLMENCVALRWGQEADRALYYINRYQEINLIGCKAFSAIKENASDPQPEAGNAFHYKDCRGVTMSGCSAAFAENAIIVEADLRNATGTTISGQTNEQISNLALKTICKTGVAIGSITYLPYRDESGGGGFELNNCTLSTIYSLNKEVKLSQGSSRNVIFSSDISKVVDTPKGNAIMGLSKFDKLGFSMNEALDINGKSLDPTFTLRGKDGLQEVRMRQIGTGFQLDLKEDSTYKKKLVVDSSIEKATSISLSYKVDGVEKFAKVSVGPVDSGGPGQRQLTIPN